MSIEDQNILQYFLMLHDPGTSIWDRFREKGPSTYI